MKGRKFALSILVGGIAAAFLSFAPMTAMAAGTMDPMSIFAQESHSGLLNINTASAQQLQKVGIGPAIAKRIVTYRSEHGSFKNVNDLSKIKGVTPKLMKQIMEKVTVGTQVSHYHWIAY